jgi:hypothetical protein
MSKRGRIPLEIKMGEERFKTLLKSLEVPQIAALICEHEIEDEKKAKCEACRRAIYRAKERLEAANRQDKTFEPIDQFLEIPEIKAFAEYLKGKVKPRSIRLHTSCLFRMWTWIRESGNPELVQLQRPAVWTTKHIDYIRNKIDEQKISRYGWIQSLRSFFKSMKRNDMLNEDQLKARRRDMRSPNGASRPVDRFSPQTYCEKIRPILTEDEKFIIDMHVTLKSREGNTDRGSLLGLKWQDINWQDNFYGFPAVTATVFETKTGGGTRWEHCPIDLWFKDLSTRLKERFDKKDGDHVFPIDYEAYRELWQRISVTLGLDFEAHDCRRSPSGWLRDLGLSDLAIGQYDARSGRAVGYAGVGWENSEIFFQRYGKMNPLAIYDKKQRLPLSEFNGLIVKILEQKQ